VSEIVSTARAGQKEKLDDRRLVVSISPELRPPTANHKLLIAFRFSSNHARDSREQIVTLGPELIMGEDRYECWWYRGDISRMEDGDIRVAECDDYAFVVLQREDVPFDRFRDHTYAAYRDLLRMVYQTGHGHLVKIWNYFPDINVGEGNSEKYRQFSIGRAEAFEEAAIYDGNMPAGTAVGPSGGGLSIIALVSKHDFLPTENPRQVSAYKYPKQYGPRSPKFSRGGCIATQDHHLFLISGTAAIIGHESRHPYETDLQIAETLENLNSVTSAMSSSFSGAPQLEFDATSMLRVYLRDRKDLDQVAATLLKRLGSIDSNIIFLRADICRRELMVEIDGVRCF
jgi:chorismate lyase/3-hydroxybenzoate synthase